MSSAKDSPATPRTRFGCLGLVCLAGLFLLIPEFVIPPFQLGIILLFGWIRFIHDVWPKITWQWGSIFTGISCAFLILFLGHQFLNWLSRSIATARGKDFRWPWKWTACGLGAITLCFLIGMAIAGAAHQIGWIAQTEESLYESDFQKFAPYHQMSDMSRVLGQWLNDTQTVTSFRTNICAYVNETQRISPGLLKLESFHILILADSAGTVESVLIFPRDAQSRKKLGGELVTSSNSRQINSANLMFFVETNSARLQSL